MTLFYLIISKYAIKVNYIDKKSEIIDHTYAYLMNKMLQYVHLLH